MAKDRSSNTALALPGRWLGGGAVALIHLCFLFAALMTDHLTFHRPQIERSISIYRLPDDSPAYSRPVPRPIIPPSRAASAPSSVLAPRLTGPMILVQPEKPLPPELQGLDLSARPGFGPKPFTQEDLLPSKEAKLKQFFAESEERNRLNREPSAGQDCQAVLGRSSGAASLGDSAFHDPLPIWQECTPRASAKGLTKRNERFAPQ